MGRTLLAVVLSVAITQAQVGGTLRPEPSRFILAASHDPWIKMFPKYTELRRGTDEKVLLVPTLNPTADDWTTTFWAAPVPRNGRLTATELTFEPLEGISITAIEYPKPTKVAFAADEEPVYVVGPKSIDLHFKVRADRTVAVGEHFLKGKLKFQRVTNVGNSEPQELEFSLPIQVVDRHAPVARDRGYSQDRPMAEQILIFMLLPVLLPFVLPNC